MSTLFGKSKKKRAGLEGAVQGDRSADESNPSVPTNDTDALVRLNPHMPLCPRTPPPGKTTAASAEATNAKTITKPAYASSFRDLGLKDPLVQTCRALGLKRPTAVQRAVIPFLLQNRASHHVLALAPTGSGKTAAFALPLLQHLSTDPFGIYAVVCSPTRELAKQIHQQILALGSAYKVTSVLVMGGCDAVRQANQLTQQRPHFCVATPGRLAELLRGPCPPGLANVRYLVMDEADRLLAAQSGFERDVAEILLHCNPVRKRDHCQTLLFSATWTESLASLEHMADNGLGRLPLQKFVLTEDFDLTASSQAAGSENRGRKAEDKSDGNASADQGDDLEEEDEPSRQRGSQMEATRPKIPAGLKQEYIFMPARVRDAYLVAVIRRLLANGGRAKQQKSSSPAKGGGRQKEIARGYEDDDNQVPKARSAILFVSTCERCALVSQLLTVMGVENVALHSLLSQNRRLAALGKFQSEQVRLLVSTDVGSRGLDIPSVDLVINVELPRQAVNYIHRVGRTARAGRRGRALSLVAAEEVALVHAAEAMAGRPLEKCTDVTDDHAMTCLGPVLKATRVAKMKLQEIGFDELVHKFRERKVRDRKERQRIQKSLRRHEAKKQKL